MNRFQNAPGWLRKKVETSGSVSDPAPKQPPSKDASKKNPSRPQKKSALRRGPTLDNRKGNLFKWMRSGVNQIDDAIARGVATAADSVLPGSPSRRAVRRNQLAVLLGADTLTEEHLPDEMLSALRTLAKEGAARRGSIQYEDFARHQNENYQLGTTKAGRRWEQQQRDKNPLPGVFTAPEGEHPFDNPFVALQYLNARQQVSRTGDDYRFHEQMGFEDTAAADSESLLDVLVKTATSGTGSFYNVRDLLGKIGGTAQVDINIPQNPT